MTDSQISITVLADNSAVGSLTTEHGLALWIETPEGPMLFDTGSGRTLLENASALEVDLKKTRWLGLSHGHFDHTGGVLPVLAMACSARVFAHRGAVQPRYHVQNGAARSIHMAKETRTVLTSLPSVRIHWVDGPVEVTARMGLTGPVPRNTAFEDPGGPFFLDEAGERPDLIEDDMALWIRTEGGIVLCTGCSHAGLVNTLDFAGRLLPGEEIRAVLGGFHLIGASDARMDRTLSALQSRTADIYPCHCTGESAVVRFRQALGSRVKPCAAGMRFQF